MLCAPSARLRFALTPPQAVTHASAVLYRPAHDAGRAGFVLAHGAGADQMNVLLRAVSKGLTERGYPVLTFNFPFADGGRRRPDPAPRLEAAYRDALAFARAEFLGARPPILGGRSMGGRIASHLAADGEPCAGLAFLGYPLHPAKRRDKLRTAHWERLRVPLLFVSGDRDALCDLDLLAREREARLGATAHRLHVVRGADHGFAVRVSEGRTPAMVREEIATTIADWADGLRLDETAT